MKNSPRYHNLSRKPHQNSKAVENIAHRIALVIDGTKHVSDSFIDMDPNINKEGILKNVDPVQLYMGNQTTPKKQVKKKLSKQPQDPGTNLIVASPPISPAILE